MSAADSRRQAKLDRHTTKKKLRAQQKAARKAQRQANRAATKRAATKLKTRPVQMQRNPREHIQALRDSNRALEKKLALLTGLLKQHAPTVAATL